MKRLLRSAASVFVLVVSMIFIGRISTALAEDHGEAKHEEKEMKMSIPATLPAIWSKISENQQSLHNALITSKLADVHKFAFAIRDHVAAMPDKSKELAKDKLDLLKKSVTKVGSLATFLDEAGDGGDSAKVATYTDKLDKELKSIEALYPAKSLKNLESKAADVGAKIYACPMHADVTSDKPGDCLKCGMKLTLKEIGGGSTHDHK